MKTTLEIPDNLFRQAKATAARRGTALKEFVCDAIEEKLARESGFTAGVWPVPPMNLTPGERAEIDNAIEEAFEPDEPDDPE